MSKASRSERGDREILTHEQPIIITGGSVALQFDSSRGEHFEPDDPANPRTYTGSGLTIVEVELYVPGSQPLFIPIPPGGCLITMSGKRNTKPDYDPITFDSRAGNSIKIDLDSSEYETQNTGSTYKWHHSNRHKVKKLEITFPQGGPDPVVKEIRGNGRCVIRIVYVHA